MGEKSGGLWLIVIVVVLAGLLIAAMTVFFPEAIEGVQAKLEGFLNSSDANLPGTPAE